MSLFSTPSPPSEAGGTGPAGGKPDFPSPTKLERNGLTGAELGAQRYLVSPPPTHPPPACLLALPASGPPEVSERKLVDSYAQKTKGSL